MATEYTYTLNEFLKDQLPELPGVIRSVALRELRLTLREFFDKSWAWTKEVQDVAIPTGVEGIQVDDSDENTDVVGILSVAKGNPTAGYRTLTPLARRPINEETAEAPYNWFVTSNPDEFMLYPYVSVATTDDLTVQVAVSPSLNIDAGDTTLPRQIILKYYDAIEAGFLARLYNHPNKPYSSPMEGKSKRTEFVKAIGYYAAQRKNGYNGAPNWGYPSGWRVSKSR